MKVKGFLFLFIYLFSFSSFADAQEKDIFFQKILSAYENSSTLGYETPAEYKNLNTDSIFLRYSHKEFNSVVEELYYYYEEIVSRMSEEEKAIQVDKVDSLGHVVKNSSLKYETVFMKNKFRNLKEQKDADSKFDMFMIESENARKNNETILSLRYKDEIFKIPRHLLSAKKWKELIKFTESYIKELDKIKSPKQYPLLKRAYSLIGQSFNPLNSSEFGEECLLKAISLPTNYYFDRSGMQALEILGIYYRNSGNLKKSDEFFLSMLTSPERIVDREVYDAVALCQLGINYIEKGQTEEAIELFLLAPFLEDKKEDLYFGQNNYYNVAILSTLQLYAWNLKRYQNNNDIQYDTEKLFTDYSSQGFVQNAEQLYWFYNEYIKTLTPQEKQKELDKIAVLARNQKSKLLRDEYLFLKTIVMPVSNDYEINLKDLAIQQIIEESDKKGNKPLKLRAMRALFDIYSDLILSYQNPVKEFNIQIELGKQFMTDKTINAFKYAFMLSDELDKVSEEEYPFKGSDSYALGRLYAFFGDTDRMVPKLEQALTGRSALYFDQSNLRARILLGRYYRFIEKIEKANKLFYSVIESNDSVNKRNLINAVALANLGMQYNDNKLRSFAKIPFLMVTYEPLLKNKEYFVLCDMFASLGWHYLEVRQVEDSRRMRDSLTYYENLLDPYLVPERFNSYNNYLYKLGACIEHDNSTMVMFAVYNKNMQELYYQNVFNPSLIREAEHEILHTSNKIKSIEIETQKKRNTLALVFIIIIGIAFTFIFCLYRKNKNANKALVAKNKDWAKQKDYREKQHRLNEKEMPDENDLKLMNQIEEYITEKQLYKDPELTLDVLAKQMNVNRNYLSKAVNATTGQNFSSWLNDYKVKEVIRLIADPKTAHYSIEAIGEMAGFGSRSTFYNVFKKSTGLSPSDFRKNSQHS